MFYKIISKFFIFLFLFTSFFLGVIFYVVNNHLLDFTVLEKNVGKASILLDDEGKEWGRFELDKRGFTKFEKFPSHLIHAFLTAEDRDFFNHSGISYKGIIRSTLINLINRKIVQGASTITQQLVKLLFFDAKRTFKRKLKEQIYAVLVEKQFSKEQILELYLNNIYFGCGIYGVEAASQRFFGKPVNEISIAQSATLAGVVKSPAIFCPLLCLQNSLKRRNLILSLMKDINYISQEEYQKEIASSFEIIPHYKQNLAVHLKETIRIFLEEKFGKQKLYSGGLKIQTTINLEIQKLAEDKFKKQFEKLKKDLNENVDGALICMESKTGEIKALVGGFNFSSSKFNRALQAKRQMGSIFKPIVYASALQKGANFLETEIDEPIEINFGKIKWSPHNNTRIFEGKMTLAKALSFSNNTISVKTLFRAGIDETVNLAKKFRLTDINKYPSIALGCVDGTLKESIGSFNVFANNGVYVEPHYLKWVKDDLGIKVFKCEPDKEQVLSPNITGQVAKVLSIGIKRYLERNNCIDFKCEAIGKTGTTNESRNCWFCGSTPEYTTAIYIGCDDHKSIGENIYAVRTVFPIWMEIHKSIKCNKTSFDFDPSLKEILVDWVSGEVTNDYNNPNAVHLLINK